LHVSCMCVAKRQQASNKAKAAATAARSGPPQVAVGAMASDASLPSLGGGAASAGSAVLPLLLVLVVRSFTCTCGAPGGQCVRGACQRPCRRLPAHDFHQALQERKLGRTLQGLRQCMAPRRSPLGRQGLANSTKRTACIWIVLVSPLMFLKAGPGCKACPVRAR
jgi:hypothetical protein